jgi:hypothetical protein
MRTFDANWRVLAGAGLLAAIAVTGCSASGPGAASDGQSSSTSTTTAPDSPPAGQPTPSASASPTPSTGIQDLLVSSTVRSQLTAAYLALRQIPASDVSGTRPNSVYYAYDQATNTYWALAIFVASKTAPPKVLVDFQDGGSGGLFKKIGSGPWQVQQGGIPFACVEGRFFPKAVLAAWAFSTSPPPGTHC